MTEKTENGEKRGPGRPRKVEEDKVRVALKHAVTLPDSKTGELVKQPADSWQVVSPEMAEHLVKNKLAIADPEK